MADSNASQLPAWAWLVTGIVTGLFLAFLYYLAGVEVPQDNQAQTAKTQPAGNKTSPKFDFYTVLPDVEAMTDKSATEPSQPAASQSKQKPTQHVIQTGSFQNVQDADRRRAELLLLGLDVKTQKVEISPGQIFHRVQVGPFADAGALAEAKKTLNEHNIEHIVLTLK